jgi:hypothetical protein
MQGIRDCLATPPSIAFHSLLDMYFVKELSQSKNLNY